MKKFILNIGVIFLFFIMTFNKSFSYPKLPLDVLSFDDGQEEILFNWLSSNRINRGFNFAVSFDSGQLNSKQVSNLISFLDGSYRWGIKVTTLDLSNVEFVNKLDFIRIIKKLPMTPVLLLNLSGHFLNEEFIQKFKEFIIQSKVRILKCSNCGIDDKRAKEIANIFSGEHQLISVDFSNNNIMNKGAVDLISKKCPLNINLRNNKINDDGIINLVKLIVHGNSNIEYLNLAGNNFGNRGIVEIFKNLKKFPETFKQINLSEIKISDSFIDSFSALDKIRSLNADQVDLYTNDDKLNKKVGFIIATYENKIGLLINSWNMHLSEDMYEFVVSVLGGEPCIFDEYLSEL